MGEIEGTVAKAMREVDGEAVLDHAGKTGAVADLTVASVAKALGELAPDNCRVPTQDADGGARAPS